MISLNEFLLFTGSLLMMMFIFRERRPGKRKDGLLHPPSLPSVPILGSIPFVFKELKRLPQFFLKKSYELGPVFYVTFGNRRLLILNNREAIEDAFVKHASSFSGRITPYMEKYHFKIDEKGFIFKNYGDEFKKYQRLTLSVLRDFGFGATSLMETRILIEVDELIKYFRKLNGETFDPKKIITISVSNAPMNILFGRRTKYEDGLCEVCAALEEGIQESDPSLDLFPLLRFSPTHRKNFLKSIEFYKRIMAAAEKEIERSLRDDSDDCFVRRYVERDGPEYDRQQLLYTIRDFIAGSTDTTSVTMLWMIALLVDYPRVLERIQQEIDSVIPRNRHPQVEDEQRMPFTQATIWEVQRHRPAAPLAVPHLTQNDTEVLGYFVPKGVVILANLNGSNMHRDDWSDPEAFTPERFLDEENNPINKTKSIPFSLGRRSCPGESLARRQLFLFTTGILQNFTILPPEGVKSLNVKAVPAFVDMPEPFEVRIIPRNI